MDISLIINILIAVMLGWIAGSMVNYISDTMPRYRRLVSPRCSNCKQKQPLRNYFIWPRRCQICHTRRVARVWITETLFIVLSVWLWLSQSLYIGYVAAMILLIYFGVVTVIDLEHRLILHSISLVGAVLGLIIGTWLHGFWMTLLGGVAGFGIMLSLYYLGHVFVQIVSRSRGQEITAVALGFGDVNLSGVIGLLLGWPGIIAGLIFAILLGGLISLLYIFYMVIRKQYRPDLALPYGPFLVVSTAFLLIFRKMIGG